MQATDRPPPRAACGHCVHFQQDGTALENAFPGFTAMGSGFASVRAQDGLCLRHHVILSARDSCPEFHLVPASEPL